MEPPVPPCAKRPSQPGLPLLPPPAPVPGRPAYRYRPTPYFLVRARADRKLAIGALAGGVVFDIAARSGVATVAVTAWLAVVAIAILLGGRLRGRVSKVLIAAVPVLGLEFFLRSSPWVIVPTAFTEVLLLFLGASLGADGGDVSQSFPALV